MCDFYLSQLAEFGQGDVHSLGWTSKKQQQIRFKQFSFDFAGKRVLDVGCGFADFAQYLVDKGQVPAYYLGVELLPEFASGIELPCPGRIIVGEFLETRLPKVDISILSGALNLPFHNYVPIVTQIITKMFKLSAIGIGFNMLGPQTDEEEQGGLFDPYFWLDVVHTLSKQVRFVSGYLPHDFTIEVRR